MPVIWYEAEVIRTESLTPYTKQISVQLPEDNEFVFTPGQFVTMDLPVGEKRLDRWRSYSIANAPDPKGILEFCIVHMEGGLGSKYLCEDLKAGDILKFKGPDGGFVLPEKVNGPLIFIATGTGVAPFRSMILELDKNPGFFPELHLIFGTRTEKDLLYVEEFNALSKRRKEFRYTAVLSRESNEAYANGYVHDVYMAEDYNIKEQTKIYICGWSKMIDQAVELLLLQKKVKKEQIRFELYG